MSYQLEKIHLPDAHIVRGQEFPVAFQLVSKDGKPDPEEVKTFLREKGETGFFKEQVQLHGAVVLRGLGSTVTEDISDFVKAIGESSGDVPLIQVGSTAKRTQLSDVLTTANEGSPSLYLSQHNEFSRFIRYPTVLFFACQVFTGKGGETPVTHGGELFEALYKETPDEVEKLAKGGLLMDQIWPYKTSNNTSWEDVLCFGRTIDKEKDDIETKKKKAGKFVADYVSEDFKWDKDNNLLVSEHTQPIREFKRPDGVSFPVSFNSIAAYWSEMRKKDADLDVYRKTFGMVYDNGKPINEDFLDKICDKSRELAYSHSWQEGDIAIVDNKVVSHGRAPWTEGERKVLVSMWEAPTKDVYPAWTGTKV